MDLLEFDLSFFFPANLAAIVSQKINSLSKSSRRCPLVILFGVGLRWDVRGVSVTEGRAEFCLVYGSVPPVLRWCAYGST